MKNILLFLSISSILFGCWPSNQQYSEEELRYLEQLKPFPLTEKEKSYISELEKIGLTKIELKRPYYPDDNTYVVNFYSDTYFEWKIEDSVSSFANKIALDLYSKILEDSVILELREIEVTIYFKSKKTKLKRIKFYQYIPIRWLEKHTGFEVKLYGEDYYSRKYIDTSKIDENEFGNGIYKEVEDF